MSDNYRGILLGGPSDGTLIKVDHPRPALMIPEMSKNIWAEPDPNLMNEPVPIHEYVRSYLNVKTNLIIYIHTGER